MSPQAPLRVTVLIESVRSLYNIGALFRVADGAGIERIVLSKYCATPDRTEISKTALGTQDSIPWQQEPDLPAYIRRKKDEGYAVYALEQTETSTDLYETELRFPMILIVGHEREGVSPELLALADKHIELPMRGGGAKSLNVATACAAALYELGRRVWYHKG